jgi:hypothetical protein
MCTEATTTKLLKGTGQTYDKDHFHYSWILPGAGNCRHFDGADDCSDPGHAGNEHLSHHEKGREEAQESHDDAVGKPGCASTHEVSRKRKLLRFASAMTAKACPMGYTFAVLF